MGELDQPAMRLYCKAPGRPDVLRVAYLVASMPVMIGLGLPMELGRLGNKARAFRDESAALARLANAADRTI